MVLNTTFTNQYQEGEKVEQKTYNNNTNGCGDQLNQKFQIYSAFFTWNIKQDLRCRFDAVDFIRKA